MIADKLQKLADLIKVNKIIVKFFIRLILLAIVTMTFYNYVLKPIRIPDKILTETIAKGVEIVINDFIPKNIYVTAVQNPVIASAMNINLNGRTILRIFDDCNGLELIAIYLSLIILLPYKISRKIIFSVAGILIFILANIIRCTILFWITLYYRDAFDFNHHYVFTILIYLLIFYGWLLFTKKGKINEIN